MSDVALSEEGDRRRCAASTSRTGGCYVKEPGQVYGRPSTSACEAKCDLWKRERTQNPRVNSSERSIAQRFP